MNEQAKNLNQALLAAMDTYAGRTCFKVKRAGRYQDISYREFQTLTFRLTKFFRLHGVAQGERVAVVADNSLEWMATYMACLLSGGVVVPLSPSLPPDMLRFILQDSGVCLGVVQGKEQSRIIEDAGEGLPDLKTVLVVNNVVGEPRPGVISIGTILAKALTPEEGDAIRASAEGVEPEALALIYYNTSKETDKPKGVVFEHAQCVLALNQTTEWFTLDEYDLGFTLQNWSYVPSLVAALNYFLSGVANALAESSETVFENLQETSPTVVLAVPYAFENIYNRVMTEMNQLPEPSRRVFQWALATGKEYRAAGLTAPPDLRERYARADMTFFSQIRAKMGGRLHRIYSDGAPLSQELVEFAEAIGLLPLNIYNIAEAGGFPAVSRPDARRPGSCGQVAPGFQVRLADDGEVLVRGETVMREYWRRPQEARQMIDDDGWLRTGDLGRFDQDGYLYLTGYKESLFMLSRGRKIMPTAIENALTASPFIAQAVVFGEGRPYVSALIVPNLEAVAANLRENGSDDGEPVVNTSHPGVKMLLDKAVGEVNSRLYVWDKIEAYTLLDRSLGEDTGEPTGPMKVNRHLVAERYAAYIDAMYPMTIRVEEKAVTKVHLDPEQLRELLEKQNILDAWMKDAGIGFLFDLARAKQIDAPSMVHICETAAAIAQMQSEEKPLSTALIVGDPAQISRILPESEVQLQRYDHIRRMRQVVITLAKMVDGLVLGYGVDKHGYLRRIHKLEVALDEPANFLLGPQFRRHAAISRQCDAVVFFVPVGGRQVRVFANGQLVGRYSNGNWSSESIPRMNEAVARVAEQKHCNPALLRQIFRCAFQMSEENLGAIFLLGGADAILERSDPPEISPFATIINADVEHLSDRELINFAKQDGATIIDIHQGKFRGCMVLLRPRANTQAEIGLGKGARHSSAAKMSAEAECLAITVSQDGPITVYDCGQRILSL